MNLYNSNYRNAQELGVFKIDTEECIKSGGFDELVITKMSNDTYSLSNSDVSITLKVNHEQEIVEALSLFDTNSLSVDFSKKGQYTKSEINVLLKYWLNNLINQGFSR